MKVSIIQRIDRKVALDDIAMTNGLEFNELLDEIEALVYSGTRINIDYFLNDVMDEDHIDDIYEYFKDSETDDLEDAIEELGGDYTEEEIRLMAESGSQKGTIDTQENEFIQNVFEFNDVSVDESCTHRKDVVCVYADESREEWE